MTTTIDSFGCWSVRHYLVGDYCTPTRHLILSGHDFKLLRLLIYLMNTVSLTVLSRGAVSCNTLLLLTLMLIDFVLHRRSVRSVVAGRFSRRHNTVRSVMRQPRSSGDVTGIPWRIYSNYYRTTFAGEYFALRLQLCWWQ